jgi:hypothetical protein
MRRRRVRTWAKWAATLAAVLAVGVAISSGLCSWGYRTTTADGDTLWSVGVEAGRITSRRVDGMSEVSVPPAVGWHMGWYRHWYWGYSGEVLPYRTSWPWHAGVAYAQGPSLWLAGASMLYPVVLTLIPAAFLWYKDRRRFGPHACKGCGYDRRGLPADAKCPECGTVPARG